ncbi:SDR family oxidoreductase [Bacillus sp. B15-48]|uniref:SDR family NAD(P)-dependent oxidoreductase n=1 Tax=Bacillus sp. B15-48 TaxID=1548601 RepID=UPI00193FAFE0|nr:SDR family oxidoreductase [Bacillus sp. B15-48]MBM4763328.1 SDR family oxidoreductase [Bacillus sp. B15-48]
MGRLDNKVAVITGAGSGMARATAILFALAGAKLVIADYNETTLYETLAEITASGGTAVAIRTDVAKEEDVEAMIQKAVDEYGRLDILANVAGVFDNTMSIENISNDLYNRVIGVNSNGPFFSCGAAIKLFKEQETGGSIVNVASIAGFRGARGGVAYTMSKHATIGLTRSIAAMYGRENKKIRANAIAPGFIKTGMTADLSDYDPIGKAASRDTGSTLMGDPEDIAQAILYLASDDSKFVNGTVLTVDGSWTVR